MTRLFQICGLIALALALAVPARAEVSLGDDGLHKPDWLQETFLDLGEDLAEATAQGKRMMVIVEQRGCIYCTKMHEEVFPKPAIDAIIRESYFVVQLNMFGDLEVTDFDGTVLSEKDMVRKWGLIFTPTMIFLPETADDTMTAVQNAVAVMPGAFERNTTLAMFTWIRDEAYETEPNFQRYFADNFYGQ
ncbi:MAG: thioredoxin family protein [Maritimibacter sp.]|nr:thioredoxin family protein [Maritimibacter sp.]